eukprot:CAMPEP_0117012560 /NCGR_PEP_ID=MMETSP0472-20121206/10544_1 /TAXON_ID=693140 ORGANISM="Tiarina fusus, Strain LIS" /NCGR_SAMPLE_ID=MMETSP0472 /ASSEMBLY_ACC=CAM_ASM_000603 /LENGTH=314 /DNA_ID=CAMNT_0004715659 /DNA_START=42 /DNA_END=986 /DNA_ORIENTATION=+
MSFDPSLIAKLNNQAVRNLISHQDFDSTIRDLAAALKADHEALAAMSASSASSQWSNNASSDLPRITLSEFPKSLLSIDNWMVGASTDDGLASRPPPMTAEWRTSRTNGIVLYNARHHQDSLYVYSHPILIPTEVTAVLYEAGRWQESERTVDNEVIFQLLQLAAIAITFNLAVAFQQAAVATAARTTTATRTILPSSEQESKFKIFVMMQRSLKLFQQSYNLCRDTYRNWHHHIGSRCSTTLFTLAALNNVAALYKALGESETASAGFQDLLSSLMMCTVFETDSNKVSRYTAFFHNTAQLSYPDCSICAGSA